MRISLTLCLLLIVSSAFAEVPSAVTQTANSLKQLLNADKVSVNSSPIANLYETLIGNEAFYISADGAYFIRGDLYESKTPRNLTDAKRNQLRLKTLNTINEKEMIVFAPKTTTKYTINVFTDVDCHYCAKFHKEVAKLNKAGVKVRYLAFPRAGVGSATYHKMVSVWCAKDKKQAMTDAKAGRKIETATCKNPIATQLQLGKSMGVTGTPALILSDGSLLPGYVPADRLIAYLKRQ
jgi:thiol:disulfide interchange protein DsbC